jgi:membrane protease YdiL (CAAX protease family)
MRRTERVSWPSVALFFVVACAVSWPFFWWRDFHPSSWEAWDTHGIPRGLAPALGPVLGAFLASWAFRRSHVRTITLVGSSVARSLAFALIPLTLLSAVGVGTDEPHRAGLLAGLAYLAYALGEEAGWRGFLQDALRPLSPAVRYVVIGFMWGAWHFTTFTRGSPGEVAMRRAILAPLAWIAGSWGVGVATDRSRSLLVAAMLHLVFNLSRALSVRDAALVLVPSMAAWVVPLRGWGPGTPLLASASGAGRRDGSSSGAGSR